MAGPGDARLAHAVDEHVAIDDVLHTARMLLRTIVEFAHVESMPRLDAHTDPVGARERPVG
jgi:hypothetical protein